MSTDRREFTREVVAEFIRQILNNLSQVRAGETTVNELRIINQLVNCFMHGHHCTVTSLHRRTRIPLPTVSRIVAQLHGKGWIFDEQDPYDGRKRIIRLRPEAMETMALDFTALADWLNEYSERGLPDEQEISGCA
jgi:DNA-binding MarR family transcriptional regulator